MNKLFENLAKACAEIWSNIGIAQKTSIVLIAIGALAAIGGVMYLSAQPNWQVLSSCKDRETASKLYELATESGVKTKLTDGGLTVMVPAADVYRLRLKAAQKGISSEAAGDGWALFDEMKLGATKKQQQILEQRAIQGELSRMIREMPGVASANVLLAFPEQKVFRKGPERRPSATVQVVTRQGVELSPGQIASIRHMVSSGIDGMRPDDVTITDGQGKLLARRASEEDAEAGGDVATRMEARSRVERMLAEKAEAILRPIVGENGVVAMVSCEMDFDQSEKVIENYDPDKATPISEKKMTNDMSKRGGDAAAGRPGTASNVTVSVSQPAAQQPAAGGGSESQSTEAKSTLETQYAVPKTVERVVSKGGRVKATTVAVSVSAIKPEGGAPWTPEDMEKFKLLVAAAVGTQKENVTVEPQVFVKPKETAPADDIPMADKIMYNIERVVNSPLLKPLFGAALLLLLYLVFKSYFKRNSVESAEIEMGGPYEPVPAAEAPKGEIEPQTPMELVSVRSEREPDAIASAMEAWLATGK